MNKRVIHIVSALLHASAPSARAKNSYQLFENIGLGPEASVTNCFLQDQQGIIWIGSNKVYSVTTVIPYRLIWGREANNAWIYCRVIIDQTYLYLGTDNGMLIYNYKTDQYETPAISFPKDFRNMALGDHLWIGTLNGLFVYHIGIARWNSLIKDLQKGLTRPFIRFHTTDNPSTWARTTVCHTTFLPRIVLNRWIFRQLRAKNLFINSLLEDVSRQCHLDWARKAVCLNIRKSNGQAGQLRN